MEIDDSNKRSFMIFAGILVFTLLSIFMIILLGVGSARVYNQNSITMLGGDLQQNITLSNGNKGTGSKEIELIAYRGLVDGLDTEQGYIKVLDYNFDYPLPLHLSQEEVSDWFVTLEVRGGYEPLEGYIDICQKGEDKGRLWMDWTYLGLRPSWYEYWNVTFKPEGNIYLDSNQFPAVDHDWFWIDKDGEIPGKDVKFDVYTLWTGCGQEDQNFEIILVQTFCFQSPQHPNVKFKSPFEFLFIGI
ncbi:MAG: hypothetical protein EAX91_02255 [Candidatus Lokiarchaeota archaeon]|nr:hypothetical protein [Candidatus Lokiarchaeota archaeon]